MKPIAALFVFAVACVNASDADCNTRKLHITVDNCLTQLYINGDEIKHLPNRYNCQKADVVPLNCDAKVIAVRGQNTGSAAGILGSADDGSVITNAGWKCTTTFYEGWMNWEYDDSHWPPAHQIGHQPMGPWKSIHGIRSDAVWIWTKKNRNCRDKIVYCRKVLVQYVCPTRDLSVTVDNYLKLYIDGVEETNLPNANNWMKSDTVPLPCNATLIAIEGTDDGSGIAGILASSTDAYVLTNASWKCTNVYYRGWETVAFDDSAWPPAHVVADHPTATLSIDPPFEANWIWTDTYITGGTVFCRKRIPGGNVQKVSQDETDQRDRKPCCCFARWNLRTDSASNRRRRTRLLKKSMN